MELCLSNFLVTSKPSQADMVCAGYVAINNVCVCVNSPMF